MDVAVADASVKPLIYILEDDSDQLDLMIEFLQGSYAVRGFANREQLLQAVALQQPTLVTLDLMLNNGATYPLCQALKKASPAKIMFITGRDAIEVKQVGYGAGCDDFMVKPFSMKELTARVKFWVGVTEIEARTSANNLPADQLTRAHLDRLVQEYRRIVIGHSNPSSLLVDIQDQVVRLATDVVGRS